MEKFIKSKQNADLKNLSKLKKKSERIEKNLFLIEGIRELSRALCSGVEILEIFINEVFLQKTEKTLEEINLLNQILSYDIPKTICSESAIEVICYKNKSDKIIGLAKNSYKDFVSIFNKSKKFLFLVAESIEKPGNLGAILRCCDAIGVDGCFVTGDLGTDLFNPNVIRSSLGTVFSVPTFEVSNEMLLEFFNKNNIKVFVATPEADKSYLDVDFTSSSAIILGSEKDGVSNFWKKHGHSKISLQMKGLADSLNVSMCATVLLYEAFRQRLS